MLERFPAGASIFLDANVLLYHVLEARPSCALLLRRAKARDIRALTSIVVLSEVFHHLMLAEAVQRFRLDSSRAALNLLRRLASLTTTRRLIKQVPALGVRVVPVRWRDLALAGELSQRYGLLTNDALIVATMSAYHLTHLATNDADFRRVPGLTLWSP